MKKFLSQLPTLLLALAIVITASSCESDQEQFNAELQKNVTLMDVLSSSSARKGAPKKGDQDLVTIAATNGNFDELVKAVIYVSENTNTDVVKLLSGTNQYTVFAPTDAAFQNLYDVLEELTGMENITTLEGVLPAEYVLEVIIYHVTEGRRASNSVVPKTDNNKIIETLLADNYFEVDQNLNVLANLNQGNIVIPNVSASNGIVHAIDVVMLPYLP